jgi:hypothetical protein
MLSLLRWLKTEMAGGNFMGVIGVLMQLRKVGGESFFTAFCCGSQWVYRYCSDDQQQIWVGTSSWVWWACSCSCARWVAMIAFISAMCLLQQQ